jgi:hypothetical protein
MCVTKARIQLDDLLGLALRPEMFVVISIARQEHSGCTAQACLLQQVPSIIVLGRLACPTVALHQADTSS